MPDTKNSTRTLYKATYTPIKATERERSELRQSMGRAFQKLNLVRSLNPTEVELDRLKIAISSVSDGGEYETLNPTFNRLVETLELHHSSNPRAAQRLASADADALTRLGNLLIAERKEIAQQASKTLNDIRISFAEETEGRLSPKQSPKANTTNLAGNTSLSEASLVQLAVSQPNTSELIGWAAASRPDLLNSLTSLLLPPFIDNPIVLHSELVNRLDNYSAENLMRLSTVMQTFEESMKIEPVGRLNLERLEMYPVSIERGELLYTVPLAPKETITVSHKEWATSSEEYEKIVQDFFESYSEKGVAEKSDMSMSSESESRHSNSFNFGATVSGGFAGVTVTTTAGFNSTSDDRETLKQSIDKSREITEKASARVRKEHKVTFKLESKRGTEDQSFRIITNPSDNKSMRVDYFRLMRKWRTDLYRYGLRMTYDIVIPNPGAALWSKVAKLHEVDRKLNQPFEFGINLSDITQEIVAPSNRPKYSEKAALYGASVLPPPVGTTQMISQKWGQPNPDDYRGVHFFVVEFDIDQNLVIDFCEFNLYADATNNHDNGHTVKLHGHPSRTVASFQSDPSNPGSQYPTHIDSKLDGLKGRTGHCSLIISHFQMYEFALTISITTKPRDSVYQQWQYDTWLKIREAAEQAHYANLQKLRDEQERLISELTQHDALTLRKMEREEIIRGTLQWLFGPGFETSPKHIEDIVKNIAQKFAEGTSDEGTSDDLAINQAQWQAMLSYGEFVKFLHQAVEWENVLYLLYPYFWGSTELAYQKRYFEHPDSMHRDFLRAGCARVVLTIRPGFEKDFTELVEGGAFKTLNRDHPYLTIAEEIQASAKTNYPGIPPANAEKNARPLLYPEQRKTWEDMQRIMALLEYYETQNGSYPQSLDQLPGGPFQDAWNHAYYYKTPGTSGEYDLISWGADNQKAGDEINADISANAEASLVARWFDYTPTSGIDIELNSQLEKIA
jgi:hypothetical protein